MWIALVLICEAGIKDPEYCFSSMSDGFFNSEQECHEGIVYAYELGILTYPPLEEGGKDWVPTDVFCYTWLEEKGDT